MKKILLTILTLLILVVFIESNDIYTEDELPGMRNEFVIIF